MIGLVLSARHVHPELPIVLTAFIIVHICPLMQLLEHYSKDASSAVPDMLLSVMLAISMQLALLVKDPTQQQMYVRHAQQDV